MKPFYGDVNTPVRASARLRVLPIKPKEGALLAQSSSRNEQTPSRSSCPPPPSPSPGLLLRQDGIRAAAEARSYRGEIIVMTANVISWDRGENDDLYMRW